MYSLALDNSWAIMDEDEMYDVNGGGWFSRKIDKAIDFVLSGIAGTLIALGAKMSFGHIFSGLRLIKGMKDVITAVKLAFWDWRVLAGLVLIGASLAYAMFLG